MSLPLRRSFEAPRSISGSRLGRRSGGPRRAFAALAPLLVGLAAGACGDSDGPPADPTPTGSDSGTPTNGPFGSSDGDESTGNGPSTDTSQPASSSTGNASGGTNPSSEDDTARMRSDSSESSRGDTGSTDAHSDTDVQPPLGGNLTALAGSVALSPAFDVDTNEYDVTLPAFTTRLTLSTAAEEGATIRINGSWVDGDGQWVSPSLKVGTTKLTVEVYNGSEVVESYIVNVHRQDTLRQYLGHPGLRGYGYFTDASDDGDTVVVGQWTGGVADPGVGVFTRGPEGWVQEAFVQHPDPEADGGFGWTLSLSGDGKTLAAGASYIGVVFLFERTENGWGLDSQLAPEEPGGHYGFGTAVELSADGNALAVASEPSNPYESVVSVYRRDGDRWTKSGSVSPSGLGDPMQSDCSSVALSLALDAKGETLVVGAAPRFYSCRGGVGVFTSNGDEWSRKAILIANDDHESDNFGIDVDVSADGRVLAVAGDPGTFVYVEQGGKYVEEYVSGVVTTAVELSASGNTLLNEHWLFTRTPSGWVAEPPIYWPLAAPEETYFGVALSGDGSTVACGPFVYSTVPSDWQAVEVEPVGHTNCEERNTTIEGACGYELACDLDRVESVCDRAEDGTWRCHCVGNQQSEFRAFTLTGGDEQSVCKSSASLCIGGSEADISEPECTKAVTGYEGYACSQAETCITRVELGQGVVAEFSTVEEGVSCREGASGSVDCQCGPDQWSESHIVFEADAAVACSLVDGLCEGTKPVGQEIACAAPSQPTQYEDTCETSRLCGRRTALDDGAYALSQRQSVWTSCSVEGDQAECTCSLPGVPRNAAVTVDVEVPRDACRVADAVCLQDEPVQVSNTVECEAGQTVLLDGQHCVAYGECISGREFDGLSATLATDVKVDCTLVALDTWQCDCDTENASAPAEVLITVSGEATCAAAAPQCGNRASGIRVDTEHGAHLVFE